MLNEFREPFEPHLQYLSRKGGAEITRLRVACLSLFYYPEEPDVAEQECHFGVRSQSVTITQTQPVNIMDAKIKLTLTNRGRHSPKRTRFVDCKNRA